MKPIHHLLFLVLAGNFTLLAARPALADNDEKALDNVVTTATLSARSSADVPAFTTVVTADDIAKTSVNSLPDLLRNTVGVNNLSNAAGRDELQIRGLGGEYTLVLVNGKRVSSGGAFAKGSDADLSSFPLNNIERVEVIRGPMAAIYGSDAIGGVVNIITKAPTDGFSGSVTGEYRDVVSGDGGDQFRVSGNLSGKMTDKVGFDVTVERLQRDAWFSDDDAESADEAPLMEEKDTTNLRSTLMLELTDNQKLDMDFGYVKDDRPYGIYSSDGAVRAQKLNRVDLALTHTGNWGWGSTSAYIKRENSRVDDYNTSYNVVQHNTQEQNTYAKFYASLASDWNNLVAGVDYRHQDLSDDVNYTESGGYSIDQLAAFAQDDVSFGDFTLSLGGRLDNHEVFGNHFSPKIYALYHVTDSITVKGGVSKAFKAPDGRELSPEYHEISCHGGCYIPGNPDLDPETSTSYEAGVEVRQASWDLTASVFKNNVKDQIQRLLLGSGTAADPYDASWINIDKVETRGYELAASADVMRSLSVSGNYTRLIAKDGDDAYVEDRPQHQANLSVDWRATDALTATVTTNYIAGMQSSAWTGSATQTGSLPSYFHTDLGVTSVLNSAFTLRGGVKNIGDSRTDKMEKGALTYSTNELGRNYYISGTYSF